MRAVPVIVRRMLASNALSFILTALVVLCATSSGETALSNGNYTWLLAVLCPFFIVFYDFPKLMRLGASKRDYYLAGLVCYALLALGISTLNTLIHLVVDPAYSAEKVINLMDVCRWTENGLFVAAVQQSCFLLLVMLFLHVLLSMQAHWYGWAADAALAAIISVFTPVAPLRAVLGGFFRLVMLNADAPVHIGVCLALSAALASAGLLVLKRETL